MSTYQELLAKAREFERLAEEARKTEMAQRIAEIKVKMDEAGLTLEDLVAALGKKGRSRRAGATSAKVIKYRGPNGEAWSGGPGRKPDWVRKILAEGGDIEQYRVAA
ncbi:MAG: H-NS histone family protein [Rhodocyclaceae bacterium]|nr:H-NS histone family protein [Rhodocyclaceae bacterium]